MQLRPLFWTIVLALAALALWACTGGDSDLDIPIGDDAATPTLVSVQASCDAVRSVERYRYVLEIRRDVPDVDETAQPTDATPDPLETIREGIEQFFRDSRVEGTFINPDRSNLLVRSQGTELEVRTIGDRSWLRQGATWQQQEPPGQDSLFTLLTLCEDLVKDLAPSLQAATGEPEVVNGIETIHYRLDKADLKGLPELLGRSGEEGLPSEFGVEVWLERNDGWPVRFETALSDLDEEGQPVREELSLEFSDIDDPNIKIEPPPVSPAQT